jgi:K+-dependent Na+/Ca+ exchanger-like protein
MLPVWASVLIIILVFYIMSKLVDGAFIKSLDNIAKWSKMPHDVAGATLLAFGTSAPEISTALVALFLAENPEQGVAIGVGTIVGSAIFQILVVIGFAALVRDAVLNWKPLMRDSVSYAIAVGLLLWFVQDNQFTVYEGIAFVFAYALYLGFLYLWTRRVNKKMKLRAFTDPEEKQKEVEIEKIIEENEKHIDEPSVFKEYLGYLTLPVDYLLGLIPDVEKNPKWTAPVFILSLAIIGYSSFWLVEAAVSISNFFEISPAIIALTVLAGGSSIPEIFSSMTVAKQGRGDMAIANAIGSNTFDVLMSLGLPVLIYTSLHGNLDLGTHAKGLTDSVILLFGSLLLVLIIMAAMRFKVNKYFGAGLITIYVAYVVAISLGYLG